MSERACLWRRANFFFHFDNNNTHNFFLSHLRALSMSIDGGRISFCWYSFQSKLTAIKKNHLVSKKNSNEIQELIWRWIWCTRTLANSLRENFTEKCMKKNVQNSTHLIFAIQLLGIFVTLNFRLKIWEENVEFAQKTHCQLEKLANFSHFYSSKWSHQAVDYSYRSRKRQFYPIKWIHKSPMKAKEISKHLLQTYFWFADPNRFVCMFDVFVCERQNEVYFLF